MANEKIEAKIVQPAALFNIPICYTTPDFQRPFVWEPQKHLKPLWEDVQKIAEAFLNKADEDEDPEPHFLGSILLQAQPTSITEVPTSRVVDGQQRLTALQLIFAAVAQVYHDEGFAPGARRVQQYTRNSDVRATAETEDLAKIRHSFDVDRNAFQKATDPSAPAASVPNALRHSDDVDASGDFDENGDAGAPNIKRAYDYFLGQVHDYAKPKLGHHPVKDRLEALEKTLAAGIDLSVLTAAEKTDVHAVFDRMNTTGVRLSSSDLIKNATFEAIGKLPKSEQSPAAKLWMFDEDYWRNDAGEGRRFLNNLDRFYQYWLSVRHTEPVTDKRMLDKYKALVQKDSIVTTMQSANRYSKTYRQLHQATYAGYEVFATRINQIEVGAFNPLILWLMHNIDEPGELRQAINAVESYLIRRFLTGNSSAGYNKFATEIIGRVSDKRDAKQQSLIPQTMGQLVVDELQTTSKTRIWPDDNAVIESLTKRDFSDNPRRQRMTLTAIESYRRGHLGEPLDLSALTVEHVMPREWKDYWPLPKGRDNAANQGRRNRAVRSIGNLTLVSGALNRAESNYRWDTKRILLKRHADLRITRQLLEQAGDGQWDEAAIAERARRMADDVIKIWPAPESFLRLL